MLGTPRQEAFNVLFERQPSVDPGSGIGCTNPPSTTLIKCVFWGGPVTSANVANTGQWRGDFHVVMAGSNGYINSSIDDAAGYATPAYFGNSIVNAPHDCNARNSSLEWKLYNEHCESGGGGGWQRRHNPCSVHVLQHVHRQPE